MEEDRHRGRQKTDGHEKRTETEDHRDALRKNTDINGDGGQTDIKRGRKQKIQSH